jgi:hypothetical protein
MTVSEELSRMPGRSYGDMDLPKRVICRMSDPGSWRDLQREARAFRVPTWRLLDLAVRRLLAEIEVERMLDKIDEKAIETRKRPNARPVESLAPLPSFGVDPSL